MTEHRYHICIVENMGVVSTKPHPNVDAAPRAPLIKCLEITNAADVSDVQLCLYEKS